jgi:hypothetical protein
MGLSDDKTICIARNCLMTEVDGDAVLMNTESGMYFGLDSVGTDVMKQLNQPTRLSNLVAALRRTYDASEATIEAGIRPLLEQLIENGLIKQEP